ncbi:MAG: hypothetical protein ACOYJK_08675 [Prevotella sp.]|jgi:hypothetical protein
MKKLALALIALFTIVTQASGMSYNQAREQALFLTDKMAYELNLTEDQYEAAYEVNLDYLMSIDNYDDLFGVYWTQRNLDLSYILFDWQYRTYVNAAYFYRPLYWDAGFWHFRIYARYPHRDYFYFGRPHFYVSYHGGHSWRRNSGRSWYMGRRYGGSHRRDAHIGMRDGFNRGDFGRGTRFSSTSNSNRSFGNGTRTNVRNNNGTRSFGRGNTSSRTRSFGNGTTSSRTRSFGSGTTPSRTRSFGNGRQSSTRSTVTRPNPQRSFGNRPSTTPRNTFTPNNKNRSFGNSSSHRSYSRPAPSTRSFGGSRSSAPSRSFGGSKGNHSNGRSTGGHFGRGR